MEVVLCPECSALFQHVQPLVAERVLPEGEGLGAESAQKPAGDDAVLIVPGIF